MRTRPGERSRTSQKDTPGPCDLVLQLRRKRPHRRIDLLLIDKQLLMIMNGADNLPGAAGKLRTERTTGVGSVDDPPGSDPSATPPECQRHACHVRHRFLHAVRACTERKQHLSSNIAEQPGIEAVMRRHTGAR